MEVDIFDMTPPEIDKSKLLDCTNCGNKILFSDWDKDAHCECCEIMYCPCRH